MSVLDDVCYLMPWRWRNGEWRCMRLYGPRTEQQIDFYRQQVLSKGGEVGQVATCWGPPPTIEQALSDALKRNGMEGGAS